MPYGVSFKHILGAALFGGLGFTMFLFIANLAFTDQVLLSSVKVGILAGSFVSGVLGYFVIRNLVKDDL